eukprot:TRINITY_DN1476_c0_g1_i15.p3 TRINITY_DN1476_c0_g1~~TRINITY_DN1476_c0_g1_i15.p3  ORF type:complete len:116 (+),score=21.30 TRINITY_DN1476_c0_g1_i15:1531-1878(+)
MSNTSPLPNAEQWKPRSSSPTAEAPPPAKSSQSAAAENHPPPTPTALASPNRSPASLSDPPKLKLAQPKISPTEQLVQQQEEMIDHFSNRRTLVSIRDLAEGITYTRAPVSLVRG